uniref:Extracellular solute-binding protein n=1 Tax=termite gut metagenome TaxID=433724 RepID=S0DFJ1_9ZZZZ
MSEPAGSTSESTGFVDGISGKNEFPFVEETRKVVIGTPDQANILDWDKNEHTLEIEEKTGLEIEWYLLPESNYNDRVNLMFASNGQMPDAFFRTDTFNDSMMSMLGAQGQILPLDDLIDKWGYNVQRYFDEEPRIKQNLTAADGKIYSLPRYSKTLTNRISQRFWVNQQFMDALNIEKLPETTEEFFDFLVKVRDGDPNGNGLKDEVPLAAAGGGSSADGHLDGFLMQPFIYMDTHNGTTPQAKRRMYMTEEGKIAYAPAQEGYREGLRYLKRLFDEGLITTEVFTLTGPDLRTMVENEVSLVGAVPSHNPSVFTNVSGERKKDFVALPPLQGPDGTRQALWEAFGGVDVGAFVIPAVSKEPDLVMKLADYLFSEESWLRSRYGVEGRDWRKPAPGVLGWDGKQAIVEELRVGELTWGMPQNVYLMGRHAFVGTPAHGIVDNGDPYHLEGVVWRASVPYFEVINSKNVPPLSMTNEEALEYNEIANNLHQYVEISMAEFVTGARSLDTDWDAYVAELEKIGYNRFLELNQAAFDRQWAGTWTWETDKSFLD